MVYPHYHAPLFILPYRSSLSMRRKFWKEKNELEGNVIHIEMR